MWWMWTSPTWPLPHPRERANRVYARVSTKVMRKASSVTKIGSRPAS